MLRKPPGVDLIKQNKPNKRGKKRLREDYQKRRGRKRPQQCTKIIFLPQTTSPEPVPRFAIGEYGTQTTYAQAHTRGSQGEPRSLLGSADPTRNARSPLEKKKNRSEQLRPQHSSHRNFQRALQWRAEIFPARSPCSSPQPQPRSPQGREPSRARPAEAPRPGRERGCGERLAQPGSSCHRPLPAPRRAAGGERNRGEEGKSP